jgi:hypothetical protein
VHILLLPWYLDHCRDEWGTSNLQKLSETCLQQDLPKAGIYTSFMILQTISEHRNNKSPFLGQPKPPQFTHNNQNLFPLIHFNLITHIRTDQK